MTGDLFEAKGITKHFQASSQLLGAGGKKGVVHAVDGVSFSIGKGETFCLVGETGSGKTTVGLVASLLLEPTAGKLYFEGQDVMRLKGKSLKALRKKVQVVFQNPSTALNPRKKVGQIIELPLRSLERMSKAERNARVVELLESVGLSPGSSFVDRRPQELSGGQKQRVAIARALATSPSLVIADEPTSALDASIRAQILNLLRQLQEKTGVSYLLIQHDLATAVYFSDVIGVMYLGQIVERSSAMNLLRSPQHPYTQALFTASNALSGRVAEKVRAEGDMPSPVDPPPACRFNTRCPFAQERCRTEEPRLREIAPGHEVACHFPAGERGGKTES